jgi:hypothetical protein
MEACGMSSITRQRVGNNTYLYESESFWDAENKRPDNNKISIGKIDALTGEAMYKQEYIDRLASEGKPVGGLRVWDKARGAQAASGSMNESEIARAVIDSVKDFGVVYFLREISEKIGLAGVLREAMNGAWEDVLCLACYLVASDKPVMYCEEWLASNAGFDVGGMSSQRVSALLASFGFSERSSFYRSWHSLIREREYIALDITSVSSYSEGIGSCEWGYNRDGEDLKQINICMLFGEDSKLPVYQTVYSGSLGDVSTLRATISEFSALTGDADIMVVMDKGFFSEKNVDMLLGCANGKHVCRFLMSVPFSNKFAKELVEAERAGIDRIENVVLTSGKPIRGVRRPCEWGGAQLNAHVFFNPEKAMREKNELFGYVASLARQAAADVHNAIYDEECKKYLRFHCARINSKNIEVSIREDVIAKELETTGWFVLLSNHIDNPQVAHDTYRAKDVVEKSFLRYKNNLGLDRLRVHSDDRMQNKIFVAFIALIIASAIYETMRRNDLFKKMTFDRLILTLAKLKSASVGGRAILRPMTKEQTDIFQAFGVRLPDYSTLKPVEPKKRGRKPKNAPSNIG